MRRLGELSENESGNDFKRISEKRNYLQFREKRDMNSLEVSDVLHTAVVGLKLACTHIHGQ
jgi:hypothetical protein